MARKQSSTSMRWIYPPDYDESHGMDAVGTSIIPELIVLGCQKYSEAYQLTLHRHMIGYEFVYLEHGSVTWEVDGVQYPTSAGQWFFTAPGELHKARFNHIEPSRIWWFIISDPARDSSWFNLGQQERNFILAGLQQLPHVFRADDRVHEQFARLKATLESDGLAKRLFAHHQMLDILLGLLQPVPLKTIEPEWWGKMTELVQQLEQTPERRYSIAEMAQAVQVSESHFYKLFQELFGQSPAAYMERVRIEHACELLLNSSLSIIDIALELGFKTSQHFTNVFRKLIGCPPSEWRRREASS